MSRTHPRAEAAIFCCNGTPWRTQKWLSLLMGVALVSTVRGVSQKSFGKRSVAETMPAPTLRGGTRWLADEGRLGRIAKSERTFGEVHSD